ncbi:hypothetical protein QAD02_018112 [Eretmocerus hayati]|uniref:Uncharacterized protein n=1 Tax=Eretmocerus hayati TaxID=131215 RepID=A0ACC2PKM5_9HYME|nr:hypothetical protein QAD02_018112 [Eretmocerus hayati]
MRRPDCRRRERGWRKLGVSPGGSEAAVLLQVPGDVFVDAGEQVSRRAVRVAVVFLRKPASVAEPGYPENARELVSWASTRATSRYGCWNRCVDSAKLSPA